MFAHASKYQIEPDQQQHPEGNRGGAFEADDIQQRAERIKHQLREYRHSEERRAGLQESLPLPGDGQHHPGECERQENGERDARENLARGRRGQQRTDHLEQRRGGRDQAEQQHRGGKLGGRLTPERDVQERFRKSQHRLIRS